MKSIAQKSQMSGFRSTNSGGIVVATKGFDDFLEAAMILCWLFWL